MVAGSASSSILKDYTYARPVINLNEDVVLTDDLPRGCTEQIGTAKCPYVVDTSAE